MKCTNCNSCMRIVRIDSDRGRIYQVCDFCNKVLEKNYGFGGLSEVKDDQTKTMVLKEFNRIYGQSILRVS